MTADEERVARMIRRGAEAVIERFGDEHGLGVHAWIRWWGGALGRPPKRWCLALVLRMPEELRGPDPAGGEVLWHVEGLSPNGAVVLFRRRLRSWEGMPASGGGGDAR